MGKNVDINEVKRGQIGERKGMEKGQEEGWKWGKERMKMD